MYHRLDADFRPLGDPDAEPQPPQHPERYQRLMYGFMKAAAILVEGVKDRPAGKRRRRREPRPVAAPEHAVTAGGVVLPTGTRDPRG